MKRAGGDFDPSIYTKDTTHWKKSASAWGKDDFKSLIHQNMRGRTKVKMIGGKDEEKKTEAYVKR